VALRKRSGLDLCLATENERACQERGNAFMKSKTIFRSMLGVALAGVFLCSLSAIAGAQQIRANWSKYAPFPSYKTYQWIPSEATNHPFYRQYVNEYVPYALDKKKGLRQVSAAQNPDLLVTYHFTTRQVMDWNTYGYGFGPGWGGWGWGGGWGGRELLPNTGIPSHYGLFNSGPDRCADQEDYLARRSDTRRRNQRRPCRGKTGREFHLQHVETVSAQAR
jgi:hypothetical protein